MIVNQTTKLKDVGGVTQITGGGRRGFVSSASVYR